MKKFLFGLMAIVLLSLNANAQSRFVSKDWRFIGERHNIELDDVYTYIKNNPSIHGKGIIEHIKTYMINKVNNSSEPSEIKKLTVAGIIKNAYAFGTLENLYPDASTANYLSEVDKNYLDKLFNIVVDDKLTALEIKGKIEILESEIHSNRSLNNSQLATLYSATNTAKFSAEYWEKNTEKWILLGGGDPSVGARACCNDGVLGADVGGAVTAALTTWMVNGAPVVGQVSYGTIVIGSGLAASAGKAIENLINSWF